MSEQDIINEWLLRKILHPDTKKAIHNFRMKLWNVEDSKNLTAFKARSEIADLLKKELKPNEKRRITIFIKSIQGLTDNTLLDDRQLKLFFSIRRTIGR